MDIGTLFGIILGLVLIIGSIIVGGGASAFIDIPSVLVTMGGTIAALLITYPVGKVKAVFAVTKKILKAGNLDLEPWYRTLVELATVARRDGLLALESQLESIDDMFMRKGVQMMIDGNSAEAVAAVMEQEISNLEDRHAIGHGIWRSMGSYAPAFGMIGTLVGLVQMLRNLSDPSSIGAGMAVALLTTFYGAFFANLFCIPIQGKLEQRTEEEVALKRMLLTGILAIQSGDSPRIVGEKLLVFISPSERGRLER